jgi:hypothetical protein
VEPSPSGPERGIRRSGGHRSSFPGSSGWMIPTRRKAPRSGVNRPYMAKPPRPRTRAPEGDATIKCYGRLGSHVTQSTIDNVPLTLPPLKGVGFSVHRSLLSMRESDMKSPSVSVSVCPAVRFAARASPDEPGSSEGELGSRSPGTVSRKDAFT